MRWPGLPRRRRRRPPQRDAALDATRDPARDRAVMVAEQLEARGITDPEILRAFRTVERHAFVERAGADPYGDHALPLGKGQTISQPYVVARMTELAQPPEGWRDARVLEIGTGSGYQAALLSELGAWVTTVERIEPLATAARERLERAGYPEIEVVVADGTEGWPAGSPYRSIMVTAGGPSVPQPLLEQLDRDGGRLVMPVGTREHQLLTVIERDGDEFRTAELDPVVFVPLIGRHGVDA